MLDLVKQSELPEGYTVPVEGGQISRIFPGTASQGYPEPLRRYACVAWLVGGKNTSGTSKALGVSPTILKKWVKTYCPSEVASKPETDESIAQTLKRIEDRLPRDILRGLRLAKKAMRSASFSQIMIGVGISCDTLKKIKAIPRPQERNVALDTLADLPPEALVKIMEIIQAYQTPQAIQRGESSPAELRAPDTHTEDADFVLLENP